MAFLGWSAKSRSVIGDPDNHGGMARHVMLDPGQSFAEEVKLTDWFKSSVRDKHLHNHKDYRFYDETLP